MAPKHKVAKLPDWLPDPLAAADTVDVTLIGERMLATVKTAFGNSFSNEAPLAIGKKGWSAPFNGPLGLISLKQTGSYQCAMNACTLKLMDRHASTNWRNVVYLAEYYWKATTAMTTGCDFRTDHFPHTIHAIVQGADDLQKTWGWCVFDKITGTDILLAFFYTIVCAVQRGDPLQPFKDTALTVQCEFHDVRDPVQIITKRIQFTENISADNKSLGFSALQEAEQLMSVLAHLRAAKGGNAVVTNQEIRDVMVLQRAHAAESVAGASGVSADAPEESPTKDSKAKDQSAQRMLGITIKIARVLGKFPQVLARLRFMEQRWGRECLCDSPAKLERIIQLCGGPEAPNLGDGEGNNGWVRNPAGWSGEKGVAGN